MWHFIEESTNKLCIIKLYYSSNNYLVNFELGGRDEETILKLYNRISNNYKKNYYVDNWQTFIKVITDNNERDLIVKEYTYPIEQVTTQIVQPGSLWYPEGFRSPCLPSSVGQGALHQFA